MPARLWTRPAALEALLRSIQRQLGLSTDGQQISSNASAMGGGDTGLELVPKGRRVSHRPAWPGFLCAQDTQGLYLMAPPGHRSDHVAPGRIPLHIRGHVVLCDVHDCAVRRVNKRQGTVHTGETEQSASGGPRLYTLSSRPSCTGDRL